MKRFTKALGALVFSMSISASVFAQELRLGGQVGAIGVGSSSGIGYGAFLMAVPYETVGLRLDATFAKPNSTHYFGISPMLAWFVPTTEEFKAGFLVGGGFHKVGEASLKFGVGGGAFGDFVIAKNVSFGGVFQAHKVFDSSDNVWSLMMSLSFGFGTADSWDW